MANALSFLADPEYWRSVRETAPNSLGKLAQGMVAGTVGAPVDIANMVLRPIGLGSDNPIGGQNSIARLMNIAPDDTAFNIGAMLPTDPTDLAHGLPVLAGIFAGKGAKTADALMLAKAQDMAKAGMPAPQIWKETGWALDTPDKLPRFEIPDNAAMASTYGKSKYELFKEMSKQDNSIRNIEDFVQKYPSSPLSSEAYKPSTSGYSFQNMATDDPALAKTIGNYFKHDELLSKAYPELQNVKAVQPSGIEGMVNKGGASFSPDSNFIKYGGIVNENQFNSTTLHELQHAVQQREGFARGGNEQEFIGQTEKLQNKLGKYLYENYYAKPREAYLNDPVYQKLSKKIDESNAFEQYKRLAGEAEARLTQDRMSMTPEQRLAQYPYDPAYFEQATGNRLADLIVRMDGGTAMSVPDGNSDYIVGLADEADKAMRAYKARRASSFMPKPESIRLRDMLIGAGAMGGGIAGGYYGMDAMAGER